jgi:hypothetical protein
VMWRAEPRAPPTPRNGNSRTAHVEAVQHDLVLAVFIKVDELRFPAFGASFGFVTAPCALHPT